MPVPKRTATPSDSVEQDAVEERQPPPKRTRLSRSDKARSGAINADTSTGDPPVGGGVDRLPGRASGKGQDDAHIQAKGKNTGNGPDQQDGNDADDVPVQPGGKDVDDNSDHTMSDGVPSTGGRTTRAYVQIASHFESHSPTLTGGNSEYDEDTRRGTTSGSSNAAKPSNEAADPTSTETGETQEDGPPANDTDAPSPSDPASTSVETNTQDIDGSSEDINNPDNWVSYPRKSYINDALHARLLRMLAYTKEDEAIYSISRFPASRAGWGNTESGLMRLCIDGTNTPITFWIIGNISTLWLFDPKDGEPNSKVSVGVTPLTKHAMSVGRYILERMSHPVVAVDRWLDHISASKWQSERVSGYKKARVVPFEDCYDAVKRYQSKDVMEPIPPEELRIGDLVLLEAYVSRYPTNKTNSSTDGKITAKERARIKAKGPAEWKITFELSSISLLHEAPPNASRFKSSGPKFSDCI